MEKKKKKVVLLDGNIDTKQMPVGTSADGNK